MKPIQDNYPFFETNQVLTSGHLNHLFDYLDENGNLTRANLIGVGIECGLEIRLETIGDKKTIHLSKGCGISSAGYLMIEPDDIELVSYQTYNLPDNIDYPRFKDETEETPVPYALWELLSDGVPNSKLLGEDSTFLDNKAVLLFLELKKENLRNCSPNNCDDKGAEIGVQVRPLLINRTDLDKIIIDSPLVNFQKTVVSLPEIPLPRVVFSKAEHLRDYEKTYRDYFAILTNGTTAIQRLTTAIDLAYKCLKYLIPSLNNTGASQLATKFNPLQSPARILPVQYYFDFLRDVTAAYHELRVALLEKVSVCLPDNGKIQEFPRHLSLGLLNSTEAERFYRTQFYPAPGVVPRDKTMGHLQFLFERINNIVTEFVLPANSAILKITPSTLGTKYLSGKSLPFYYSPGLRPNWDAYRKDTQSVNILSWHEFSDSPAHVKAPFSYDLEPYNFLRFEGLLGKNQVIFSTELSNLVITNRLPVSVIYLNADALGGFLEKHPAISHEAGSLYAGTFVVLYRGIGTDINLTLADFALPYRVSDKEDGCLCRVMVQECAFEWFDTPRHLGNLVMREYRFGSRPAVHPGSNLRISDEQEKAKLADFYVIRIYKYEIQGHSMISNTPTDISVPIADLKNGKLSAVARYLNSAFTKGVVFDYKPDTNKILIRYFSDQNFRIEWGGLQGNQIRYAYEPGGISRWQYEKWELLDNPPKYLAECHLRNEYRPEEYRWLQEDDYFDAKYPTPASMPGTAELIQWEEMIRKRSKITLPIKSLLDNITDWASESMTGGSEIHIVLIGSWANGSWISLNHAENKFPEKFLSLLNKITGRGNAPSDIDLLINMDDSYDPAYVKESIQSILSENNSIYKINIMYGKKDTQKGIVLI